MSKVVWITGAGSGIGAAMAQSFAAAGYRVALTARTEEALNTVGDGLPTGTECLIIPGDVTDRNGMRAAVDRIVNWGGGLHVVCNNAGFNVPNRLWADLDSGTQDSWDRVFDINVTGALNVIAASLPQMRAQHDGVLIHTSSWAGRYHTPASGVAYGASKHALLSISAGLNSEEGRNGIRSTALFPGKVATPLVTRRPDFDPNELPQMIQSEDMARIALFVAQTQPGIVLNEIVIAPVRR